MELHSVCSGEMQTWVMPTEDSDRILITSSLITLEQVVVAHTFSFFFFNNRFL